MSLEHPRVPTSYYKNLKYLGKRVMDIGKVGLDKPEEFLAMIDEIIEE